MSSDSGSTGSQVRLASTSSARVPGEQQGSVKALSAKFTEWLLEAAVVRSAVVDGVTTFQLQFKADRYCSKHRHHGLSSSKFDGGSSSQAKWRNSEPEPITSVASTHGMDPLVSQSDDDVQSTSTEEAEYKVEKILKIRKRGRGHQARVKWVGFKRKTWEPLKNFLGTAALDDYEARHGKLP
ncbi:hypothetical protein NKR23_g12167 [Pleurostoma richardsiae]|uniref:Chromo domain-containing protein n=1 Tax=Pleurostoma richardsiae TaxID=41990 RepID=A0AA38R1V1_9PEZI|nr:hypothetical protein NKR23_g12167 [Pleurostoma richardsiae]